MLTSGFSICDSTRNQRANNFSPPLDIEVSENRYINNGGNMKNKLLMIFSLMALSSPVFASLICETMNFSKSYDVYSMNELEVENPSTHDTEVFSIPNSPVGTVSFEVVKKTIENKNKNEIVLKVVKTSFLESFKKLDEFSVTLPKYKADGVKLLKLLLQSHFKFSKYALIMKDPTDTEFSCSLRVSEILAPTVDKYDLDWFH